MTLMLAVCLLGARPLAAQFELPSLSITKSAPATVASGAELTYTITYGNSGTAGTTGVVIKDPVPAGASFVEADGGGTVAGGVVTWNLGTLAAGVVGQTVTFKVLVTAASGTIVNQGYTIESSQLLPAAGPSVSTVVGGDPAVLTVQKTASTPTPLLGVPFQYQVVVSNTGGTSASPVEVSDTLPAGLAAGVVTIVSSGSCNVVGQVVSCSIPSLSPEASATVTIPVTPSSPGTVTNTASASFPGGSGAQGSATVTVRSPASESIPTASLPGLVILGASLGAAGLFAMRRAC